MLTRDFYQDVQMAVKESADALVIDHNPRAALRKAHQAAYFLGNLIEELDDYRLGVPKDVWESWD